MPSRKIKFLYKKYHLPIYTVCLITALFSWGEYHAHALEVQADVQIVYDPPGLKYFNMPAPDRNTHNFHEREIPTERTPGTLRVAALGDSTTYGMMLSREQAWPGQLEAALNKDGIGAVEVLNFGVPAYDIEQIVMMSRYVLAEWRPDVVVYGFYWNDPSETRITRMGAFPTWVGTGPRPFFFFGEAIDAQLRAGSALFRQVEGEIATRYLPEKEEELDWGFFEYWAKQLIHDQQAAGVPLIVLTIPSHVLSTDWPDCDQRAGQWPGFCEQSWASVERAGAWFSSQNIPVANGLAAYRASPAQTFFLVRENPSHPSAAGHTRLSTAVHERILPRLEAIRER